MMDLDVRFGVVPRHFHDVGDLVGLFSGAARRRLRQHLRRLHARFPQVRLSIFACNVPNRPPRAYGFWLFNRCRFHEVGANQGRCFALLLVLNKADQSVSLTAGYGLEQVCAEEDLQAFLAGAAPFWKERQYEKGILVLLEKLTTHLKAKAAAGKPPLPQGAETGAEVEQSV